MLVEEHEGSVLYRSEYNPYFKTDCRLFPALEFLVQLLQHLPDPRTHLVRRYGLYSSRSRGTWSGKPWLRPLAPEGLAVAAPAAASPFCARSTPGQRRAVCLHSSITFRMGAAAGQSIRGGRPSLQPLRLSDEGACRHY